MKRSSFTILIEDLDVPKELAEYRFDKASVKREVEEIRLKSATIEAGEAVEAGDFIEIEVNGNSQHFPVTVGLGLVGKKTEQSFLGLRVGDTVIATEQPFLEKEVTICDIKRRILPEFSDQMAIELGYQSVIDYQERRCEEMRSQVKRDCARMLVQQECLGKAEYEQRICTLAKKYLMNEDSVRKSSSFKTVLVEEYLVKVSVKYRNG